MRLAGRRAAPSYLCRKSAILQKAHAKYCHLQIFTNMKLAETSKPLFAGFPSNPAVHGALDAGQKARMAEIAEKTPVTLTLKGGVRIDTSVA
jgi:uncharacterized OsmC-like protein